jgi:hypothetical protein
LTFSQHPHPHQMFPIVWKKILKFSSCYLTSFNLFLMLFKVLKALKRLHIFNCQYCPQCPSSPKKENKNTSSRIFSLSFTILLILPSP